ncbi:MAG TPA: sulfatase [bacterium]|nr:sulfatase [bacterium]
MSPPSRPSRWPYIISAFSGVLLVQPYYSIWLCQYRSLALFLIVSIFGAALGCLLMRLAGRIMSASAGEEKGSHLTRAALLSWSMLGIYIVYAFYYMQAKRIMGHTLAVIAAPPFFYLALAALAGLLSRPRLRLPLLILSGLAAAAALIWFRPRPPLTVQFPTQLMFSGQGPPLFCLEQDHLSRMGRPLMRDKPLDFVREAPAGAVLEFQVYAGPLSRGARPGRLRVAATDPAGRAHELYREEVAAGGAGWEWRRVGLSGLSGRKLSFRMETVPARGGGPATDPVYVANISVFAPPPSPPPNVIMLVFDAMRADALGCYGREGAGTSALDALAADGVLFQTAISPCSWTAPAVASILTSRYPSQHHVLTSFDPLLVTLPQALSSHGIRTGAVVGNNLLSPLFGFNRGFQEYYLEPFSRTNWRNAELTMEDAISRIRRQGGHPFFLYIHVMDPHHPYFAPPGYGPRLSPASAWSFLSETARFFSRLPYIYEPGDEQPRRLPPDELSDLIRRYQGEVEYASYTASMLTSFLHNAGLWSNTLLIITSDHGEAFDEHGYLRHGQNLYLEEVHVPLIFTGGVAAGRRRVVTMPVSTLDLFPTVLDIQGVPLPDEPAGRSLAALIQGQDLAPVPVFSERLSFDNNLFLSMIEGTRQFIKTSSVDRAKPATLELYDWAADPREQLELGAAHPGQLRDLELRLDAYFASLPGRTTQLDSSVSTGEIKKKMRAMGYLK